ncbi:hypothetical protein [Microvirga massiliensis]|uniref:hypothetical protein n=1 Tax=Microvirga massiliensis TaxID=1033741 RepID=UPI00062BADDF|nr:hypothetical protein [Microvirga massiliensis]
MDNYMTTGEEPPCVSYLREVYFTKERNQTILHQSKITDWECYPDFDTFAQRFWATASYPSPQSNKMETYSFTPTLFEQSQKKTKDPSAPGKWGHWRNGEYSAHQVSLFYADLDNQHPEYPYVTFEQIAETLKALRWKHLLYTSFSHKPERHKVRIIVPISRAMTNDEAFRIFIWLNAIFEHQLDGSIYDDGDHLYGPCFIGRRRESLEGGSLNVDALLSAVESLPDEALRHAQRGQSNAKIRPMTDKEFETYRVLVTNQTARLGLSVHDARVFNPQWAELLHSRYNGGSRRQSLLGVLTKIWLKSKRTLSFGDMRAFQQEIDVEWYGGYCERQYGRSALEEDVRAAMQVVGSPDFEKSKQVALERRVKSLRRYRA